MYPTKNIYKIIAGLVVMLGLLLSFWQSTFFSKDNDFRIADTLKVNRIEILAEDSIILTRSESKWLINNEMQASPIAITNFLFSFMRMDAKDSKDAGEIENISTIRIKIFEGRKKHLYRFYSTNGSSFLLKEGSKKLYSVEVNGFPNIKPYEVINPDPDFWRERTLINLQAGEIKEISLSHPSEPLKDFSIKVQNGNINVFDGDEVQIPVNQIDTEKLNFYLSYFTNVFYDGTVKTMAQENIEANWILKVEDTSGKRYELKIYPYLRDGKPDMFLGLVKYNNEQEFKLIRFMVLDLLLQDKEHFLVEESTK